MMKAGGAARHCDISIQWMRLCRRSGNNSERRRELRSSIMTIRRDLEAIIEHQTLRLTVRLGGIVAIGVAILATIIKL